MSLLQAAALVSADLTAAGGALALLMAGGGAALVAGFLTPLACAIVAIAGAAMACEVAAFAPFAQSEGPLAGALLATIAVAMACLGPGAFSLDARLFGRREVLIRR